MKKWLLNFRCQNDFMSAGHTKTPSGQPLLETIPNLFWVVRIWLNEILGDFINLDLKSCVRFTRDFSILQNWQKAINKWFCHNLPLSKLRLEGSVRTQQRMFHLSHLHYFVCIFLWWYFHKCFLKSFWE